MIGILLAGAVGYKQLPVSALPEVDYPTIQVVTFYPGASPEVMASSVTAPLERQFGQVPGLQQMTSTSSDGSSVIVLQFNLNLNIDVAEQEVQQSINAAGTFLPVKGRVARAMLDLAAAFGNDVGGGRIVIRQKLSQSDVAAMAGIARENVSRILNEWMRLKLVTRLAGYYCIENASKLERELKI